MKTNCWVNVTSSYHWRNHTPVGINRVEMEAVKELLTKTDLNLYFFVYSHNTNKYYSVPKNTVIREILKNNHTNYKKANNFDDSFKKNIKKTIRNKFNNTPLFFRPILFNLFAGAKKIYLNMYLIPKFYFLKYTNELHNKILKSIKEFNSKNHDREYSEFKEANFQKESIILTLGLDWDFLNINNLYNLKKKLNIKPLFFCYDMIPIIYPQYSIDSVANNFANYFVGVAWTAQHIFCISKNTKNDLEKYIKSVGARKPNISVIRLGDTATRVNKSKSKEFLVSENIKEVCKKPFILYVSTIERRKNHDILYKTYHRLLSENKKLPNLIFVGMVGWGVNDTINDIIKDPIINGKINILSNVSDIDLDFLYENCLFTVYPSMYEGWGLPIAESLSYGKFCIASNTSSIPEVGKELIDYADPWDINDWSKKILLYSKNVELLKIKQRKIKKEFEKTTWSKMGNQIYREIIKLNN